MMIYESRKLGLRFSVLDSSEDVPAGKLADRFYSGSLESASDLERIILENDVTTYDIEHINTEALGRLSEAGHAIFPAPEILAIIQDKGIQKKHLQDAGIPVPAFSLFDPPAQILSAPALPVPFPAVQKARRGGYDGRGVAVLRNEDDLDTMLPVPSMLEEFVDFEVELAVMVARDRKGEVRSYPVTEMYFDENANICDTVIAPARFGERVEAEARRIAEETVVALAGVGVFGIELFLTKDGKILVNEVAPRPHNSGHYTIEGCATSQFEQHIRAVAGFPLGSTDLHRPAVMFNLLGAPGFSGRPVVRGLSDALAIPGASVHLYRKSETRPYRKMGHVTVTGRDVETVLGKAERVRECIRIEGERNDG
jgi:5-(carboxyamino)imidazole ribonucleotide synthase